MDYTRELPDYAWRCFHRIDFICGGVLAILYFFAADAVGVGHYRSLVTLAIVAFALAEAGYGVYREERTLRRDLESALTMTVRPSRWTILTGNPFKVDAIVVLTIWPRETIATSELAMNLVGLRHRKWWQVWRRLETRLFGIAPNGQDVGDYTFHDRFELTMKLPITLHVSFKADGIIVSEYKGFDAFGLEISLKTGIPGGTYREYVTTDFHLRGVSRPL